jgi:hypothetical protein
MDLVTLRRNNTTWAINQNPTSITISRTGKVRQGGGFKAIETIIGPLTVRISPKKSRSLNTTKTDTIGTRQEQVWFMIADYQADVKDGPETTDEFDVSGLGHFIVKNVYPQMVNSQVVGYQVDIEKVS